MNAITLFNEVDKETDVAAYNTVPYIIPTLFAEIHVLRSLFVFLSMIAGNIVIYPFQLIRNLGNLKDPQCKYAACIFLSTLFPFVIPFLLGYDVELALDFVKGQKFYKIWAIYTLFFIIQKFLVRVHVHTHKIIRGAIREGKSVVVPTLLHSISNFFILFAYNVYSGTYLAGLYGKAGIFISACLHIQAVVTKKYLPKVLDIPPQFSFPTARIVLIYSIALHLSMGEFSQVIALIEFEYIFVTIKMFLTALSEDSANVYQTLKVGADMAFYQFSHNDAPIDDSIIANVPIEVFAINTLFLLAKGPIMNTAVIAGVVLFFAIVGRLVVKLLCPKTKPVLLVVKKDKKDKKNKKNKDGNKAEEKPEKKEEKVTESDEKVTENEKAKTD